MDVKKRWGEKKAAAIDGKETEERAEREEEKFKRITEWQRCKGLPVTSFELHKWIICSQRSFGLERSCPTLVYDLTHPQWVETRQVKGQRRS